MSDPAPPRRRERRERPEPARAYSSKRSGGVPRGVGRWRCAVDGRRGRPSLPGTATQRVAALLALLVAAAAVGGIASVATATGAAAPGLVGVPDGQISTAVPEYAAERIPERAAWTGAAASRGADSLELTVTTRAAARGRASACNAPTGDRPAFCDSPVLAVELTDDADHRGRTVALPLSAVREATGRVPGMAYGTHDSGDRWRSPTRIEDGLLLFEVPRFSTNTVTFRGTVSVVADPATDGSTIVYDLVDLEPVSAPNATLTGRVGAENDTETGTDLDTGLSVAGTLDPTGWDAADPLLLAWAHNASDTHTNPSTADAGAGVGKLLFDVGGTEPRYVARVTATLNNTDTDFGKTVDLWWSMNDTRDDADDVLIGDDISLAAGGSRTVTVVAGVTDSTAGSAVYVTGAGWTEINGASLDTADVAFSVDAGAGAVALTDAHPLDGGSARVAVPLSTTGLTFTGASTGLDWELRYRERQETVDPAVEINGNTLSHAGGLAAGETVTLTGQAGWLKTGTNRINVSVGPPADPDAPVPPVGADLSHDAAANQTVECACEKWSERYNASRTFARSHSGATLTVDHHAQVVAVRSVSKRVNGSVWASVPESDVTLDGTTMTVALGDVDAGATVEVRSTASKVAVYNGSIQVVEPTVLGDDLATTFDVEGRGAGFAIDVSGTPDGDRLHYLSDASWTADERVHVTASGSQVLRLPDATAGGRATVRTLPLAVEPDTGDVVVAPVDPDGTPELQVRPGDSTGDAVAFRYYQTVSGHRYVLDSVSAGARRDSAVASSPVLLWDDDSSETLTIYDDGATDDGGTTGGGGGGPLGISDPLESTPVVVLAGVVALAVAAVVGARFLPGWQAGLLAAGAGAVVLLGVGEAVSPVDVFAPIADGLGQVAQVAGLAAVLVGAYVVYRRMRGREPPQITIMGRVR